MQEINEVRYERLKPAEIVSAREAAPIAYLPTGTIEWHGFHNPVGLDTLKAHALAIRCAQRTGGLVFPPLYYGESRETALMEANAGDRARIAEGMGLPPENFAAGYMHTTLVEQSLAYIRLQVHILFQIKSLGFKVAVLVPGHYPLLDHARSACALFHQMCPRPKLVTWAFTGYEIIQRRERFDVIGDHAGKWETSLLMALDPGMVDLERLPAKGEPLVGATNNGVQDASAEYGERAVDAILESAAPFIRHLVENTERYQGHGAPQYTQSLPI